MKKLFNFKQAQPDLHAPDLEKRYTRFPHAHTRVPSKAAKQQTAQPCQSAPVSPRRPSAHSDQDVAEPASLADQLHSEAKIPTALLRRALPLRFADIDAQTHEIARKETESLKSQFR